MEFKTVFVTFDKILSLSNQNLMPQLFILAGCNGAGKITASKILLPEVFGIETFVNADMIAAQINPDNPESVAIQAGRIMLGKIDELLSQKKSCVLEITLATKSYVKLVKKAESLDYEVILTYFWIESDDYSIERVARRVRHGGHNIPEDVVRRRYENGIRNMFKLFMSIVDKWSIYDNSDYTEGRSIMIAKKLT
jgi:predicted ABC-type ATPase